jgi:hypothetical protein
MIGSDRAVDARRPPNSVMATIKSPSSARRGRSRSLREPHPARRTRAQHVCGGGHIKNPVISSSKVTIRDFRHFPNAFGRIHAHAPSH